MRKIFYATIILLPFVVKAQEIGSAGRWLQNENRRSEATDRYIPSNLSYRWEMTYDLGYAEVFIRIPESGRFTLQLGEQEITNSNGMFRFFDVPTINQELSIYYGRRLVYRVTITPRDNTRMVLDFFSRRGLFLLEEVNLNNVREIHYGRRWNDVWNHSYGRRNNILDFNDFLRMFEQQMFDKDKLKFFRMENGNSSFTTAQVGELMKRLSFDDNRLILAKEAYDCVIDRELYYQLYDMFQFRRTANEFSDFLTNRRSLRR